MTQPISSQQELITVVSFEGFLLLGKFPVPGREQLVPVIAGISQEVFRENSYLGSVSGLSTQPVKARRGDTIYRVLLAPRPESCKGVVVTTDRYQREYKVDFDVVVRDAKRCVEQFRNGLSSVDLINYVVYRIRNATVQYLQQYKHDEIGPSGLKIDAYNTILKNEYGLGFTNLRWTAEADPRRLSEREAQQKAEQRKREIEAQIHELERQAYLRKEELRINASVKYFEEDLKREQEIIQKQYERDEKARHSLASRQEKMLSQLGEARIKLLNKTVDDLIQISSERIQDAFDSNASASATARAILEDSLRLIGVFNGAPDKEFNENVINSSFAGLDNPSALGEEDNLLVTEEIKRDTSEM